MLIFCARFATKNNYPLLSIACGTPRFSLPVSSSPAQTSQHFAFLQARCPQRLLPSALHLPVVVGWWEKKISKGIRRTKTWPSGEEGFREEFLKLLGGRGLPLYSSQSATCKTGLFTPPGRGGGEGGGGNRANAFQ